jgi:hypothetical protein
MSRRKLTACLALCVSLVLTHFITARVMVVHATLPPQSARTDVLMALVKPPYQMAAPHYSLLKQAREFFMPTVHAYCPGDVPCGNSRAEPYQNPNCNYLQNGSNYCPDCTKGPCALWHCVYSTNQNSTCDDNHYNVCGPLQFHCQTTGVCTR